MTGRGREGESEEKTSFKDNPTLFFEGKSLDYAKMKKCTNTENLCFINEQNLVQLVNVLYSEKKWGSST